MENKKLYDVKIETTVPATVVYRVLASSEEEALQIYKSAKPLKINYDFLKRKDLKLTIFEAGTSIIKFVKRLL